MGQHGKALFDQALQSALLQAHRRLVSWWEDAIQQIETQVGVHDRIHFDQGNALQPIVRLPCLVGLYFVPNLI